MDGSECALPHEAKEFSLPPRVPITFAAMHLFFKYSVNTIAVNCLIDSTNEKFEIVSTATIVPMFLDH